jgi:hypothetical protein
MPKVRKIRPADFYRSQDKKIGQGHPGLSRQRTKWLLQYLLFRCMLYLWRKLI